MEKKKTVKTFQRRTKSGKTVTVRQHESKYSAADAKNEELKKKTGAGGELAKRKNAPKLSPEELQKHVNAYMAEDSKMFLSANDDKHHAELVGKNKKMQSLSPILKAHGVLNSKGAINGSHKAVKDSADKMSMKDHAKMQKEVTEKKTPSKEETTRHPGMPSEKELNKKGRTGPQPGNMKASKKVVKSTSTAKKSPEKTATPSHGVSAEEYKSWYHWDMQADPKNKLALSAQKKMKAHMGASAYKKHFNDASESYSARGHNKAYNSISAPVKTTPRSKEIPSLSEAKKAHSMLYKEYVAKGYNQPGRGNSSQAADKLRKKMRPYEDILNAGGKPLGGTDAATVKKSSLPRAKKTGLAKLEAYKPVGNAGGDSKFFSSVDKFIKGDGNIDQKYEALKLIDKAMGVKSKKEDPRSAVHSYLTENGMSHDKAKRLSGFRGTLKKK